MKEPLFKKLREKYDKKEEDTSTEPIFIILAIVILWILITKVT